ncbi:MAG TPA: hypothetical protein VGF76_06910 [Polyangiaceae bacterium]|jgi:hypothetical protein
MSNDDSMPIVCRPSALTPNERKRSQALRRELASATQATLELAEGYAFLFRADVSLFQKVSEWISLERRCCPFLTFDLAWAPGDDIPSRLSVTGPVGTKAFMAAEMVGPGEDERCR